MTDTLLKITLCISVTASVLHAIAYITYNVQAKLGTSSPNAGSWLVWAFVSTLNALSYREMSGDWVRTLQFYTGSVMCILTVLFVFAIGKFTWPEWKQWVQLVIALSGLLAWKQFGAASANMVIMSAFVFSWTFTLAGVWNDPSKESPLAWSIWTVAFSITTVNNYLRHGDLITYVTPGILIVTHLTIALLVTEKRKRRFAFEKALVSQAQL